MKSKALSFLIGAVVIIVGVSLSNYGFAQSSPGESITITTYYPSPYGSYKDLQTKRLVIGDDAMPDTDAVVNFQGLGSDPSFSHDGALYYSNVKHEFRYYDGGIAAWRRIGGFEDFLIVQNSRSLHGDSKGVWVYCPPGYIRIACSGGLDFRSSTQSFWDSGGEGDKGYSGAAPVVNGNLQGCTAFADGGDNIYVWAYCIK